MLGTLTVLADSTSSLLDELLTDLRTERQMGRNSAPSRSASLLRQHRHEPSKSNGCTKLRMVARSRRAEGRAEGGITVATNMNKRPKSGSREVTENGNLWVGAADA